jgi:hypothetical protein
MAIRRRRMGRAIAQSVLDGARRRDEPVHRAAIAPRPGDAYSIDRDSHVATAIRSALEFVPPWSLTDVLTSNDQG